MHSHSLQSLWRNFEIITNVDFLTYLIQTKRWFNKAFLQNSPQSGVYISTKAWFAVVSFGVSHGKSSLVMYQNQLINATRVFDPLRPSDAYMRR